MPRLTVAIVGAGLNGLLFAIALQKFAPDVDFVIYEGTSQLAEIGAGITMRTRTWAIMQALGLDEALSKIAGDGDHPSVSVVYRKSDQAEGVFFSEVKVTEISYTFHRGELHKVFLDHIQPAHAIHLGKRLVSYAQSETSVELRFQDGTSATCDILVGCDGVRSAVRGCMYAQLADAALKYGRADEAAELRAHIAPVFSGTIIYRALIKKEALTKEQAAHQALNNPALAFYCGKDKHLITFPISQGRILNVGAVVTVVGQEGTIYQGPWTSIATKEEVAKYFSGWEPDAQEIIKHMDAAPLKWVINVIAELPTYVHNRVALLGDAAHAMNPSQGAGAGQGFEDAFLLAHLLGHPRIDESRAPAALPVYDEIRRPFSQMVAAQSRRAGQLHQLNSPEFADLTAEESATGSALTLEQLRMLGEEIDKTKEWRTGPTIVEEAKAPATLQRLLEALSVGDGIST